MAYNQPWDETTPDGATTPANTIDTLFQNLKEAISERITDVVPDWDNDAVDPKTIAGTAIEVDQDVHANRPVAPANPTFFYATDRETLYMWDGAAWWNVSVQVGARASRPAAPETDNHIYVASDTGEIFITDGAGGWDGLVLRHDTYANRPAAADDLLFFTTDREQLFMTHGATDWHAVSPYVADVANLPASPEGLGDMFIGKDTHQVYINDGADAWEQLIPATYSVGVELTANQTIPDSTTTSIDWSTVLWEYGDSSMVDLVADDSILFAPITGVYLAVLQVQWATGGAGFKYARIRHSDPVASFDFQVAEDEVFNLTLPTYTITNTSILRTYDGNTAAASTLSDVLYTLIQDLNDGAYTKDSQTVTAVIEMEAGDFVSFAVEQSSGGNLDILGALSRQTHASLTLLSPQAPA